MKKNVTYVSQSDLVSTIVDAVRAGWRVEERTGWMKLVAPQDKEVRVYIPLTKKVGRIELAGFTVPLELGHTVPPHQGPYGKVFQTLNMGGDRGVREILASLAFVLERGAEVQPTAAGDLSLIELVKNAAMNASSPEGENEEQVA